MCPISDSVQARTLSVPTNPVGGASNNSVQSCTDACFAAGYPLAGMEYSDECCMCLLSPQCSAFVHSLYVSKIAAILSLMAALQHLLVIVP